MTSRSPDISPSPEDNSNMVKAKSAGCKDEMEGEDFDEDEDNEDVDDGEVEDVVPEILKQPEAPTAEEWREHEIVHCPYRSWCPICVQARGRALPHKRTRRKRRNMLEEFQWSIWTTCS